MTFPGRRLGPLTQRVRARIGKRIILDTTHAQLLFEDERRAALTHGASYWTAWYSLRLAWAHAE
jgi:hypothetical protein